MGCGMCVVKCVVRCAACVFCVARCLLRLFLNELLRLRVSQITKDIVEEFSARICEQIVDDPVPQAAGNHEHN